MIPESDLALHRRYTPSTQSTPVVNMALLARFGRISQVRFNNLYYE